jgi:CRP-like cAMP-binding protein/coenzyme F420-reducing hydrogenase gamma subunit
MVEVRKQSSPGGRGSFVPACHHRVEADMEVHTLESPDAKIRERLERHIRTLVELLAADHGAPRGVDRGYPTELEALMQRFLGEGPARFGTNPDPRGTDDTSRLIQIDHSACILCDRCIRACTDVKHNDVIGRSGKGYTAQIAFDLNDPMGRSSCVSCGECMISCPTDALTFRSQIAPQVHPSALPGENLSAADVLQAHPLLKHLPPKFLDWNTGAVRRITLEPGRVLCREGDAGSTAYLIVSGKLKVTRRAPSAKVQNERAGGWLSWLGIAKIRLTPDRSSAGAADIELGELTSKDLLFGEMTCLNHYPRSATVEAIERTELLEITQNILHYLQRNPTSRAELNRVYRSRALQLQLQQLPFVKDLPSDDKQRVAELLGGQAELVAVDPGQVICRQGEVANYFYLVRIGFVKVSQTAGGGGERVLDYLGPGRFFGEVGILTMLEDELRDLPPPGSAGRRIATCSALDTVELVRIGKQNFVELIRQFPTVRRQLTAYARRMLENLPKDTIEPDARLADFLKQGLFNAQKLLVLDLESCTRCDECVKACADTHDGVTRLIRDGMRFERFLVASSCRSCLDPYCLVGCPVDAIHREQSPRRPNSLEIVIESHCIGCGTCANNCPYGNINMHEFADPLADSPERKATVRKATTCDLCRNVVGENEDPSCVFACPHNAAFRMSGPQLLGVVEGTLPLDSLLKR